MSDENMRDSGIEWIGEIPAEWDTTTIDAIYRLRNEQTSDTSLMPLSITKMGVLPQLDTAAKSMQKNNKRKIVYVGDFVINSRSDRRGSCGISNLYGTCAVVNTVMSPCSSSIDCNYYGFLFKTDGFADEFYKNGHGIVDDLWTTTWNNMRKIQLPLPPLPEQRRIATYLDARVSRIDRLVDGLSRRVELLDEYKKSLISETVTKGIRQHENMKDSGIEWVGEIPAEWDVAKCQYVMMSDKKIAGMRSSEYQRISLTMNGVVPRDKNDRDGLQPRDFDSYQIVRQNQLIFKLIDLANKATSRVGLSPYEGITSPAYIIASCDEGHLTARYAYYYFTDMYFRYVFNGLGNDGVRSSLTKTALMNLKIVLPPLHEQREIAAFLDERVSVIDRLMDACRKQIDSLGEYKKSLISECVTGKRRITDADLEGVSVA